MAGRKGREVVRVRGEVIGPEPPRAVARPVAVPLPARTRDGQPVIVVREYHHHAAPARAAADGMRWAMLAAYAFGLLMLVVFVVLLIAAGAIDLTALRPPWQETGR